jgi:ribonucleoside-diphosphate reductase alpha chain
MIERRISTMEKYGPTLQISEQIHKEKYRGTNESFYESMNRLAGALHDGEEHRTKIKDIFLDQRFLPAGRVQAAVGSPRQTTAFNCFVSQTIEDSTEGIMDGATNAFKTMRKGGGIGYDFSTLRYRGAPIQTLGSKASGAVSFMDIYDAVCNTVSSAGNRRGAQMGVLRVDHPDIEEFIRAKQNDGRLKNFNISVAVTDKFMEALENDEAFDLVWDGKVVDTIDPSALWDEIMRATWEWAEPGVLFIDTINEQNNLRYCEYIAATNPCGEQPLPPYGACLLGSFNLVKYIVEEMSFGNEPYTFNWGQFKHDIPHVVRAMDNVVDRTIYPLPEQEFEAKNKRRIGLGITGFANASEILGWEYGGEESVDFLDKVMSVLKNTAYMYSAELSIEKGTFPVYDARSYHDSPFIKGLDPITREVVGKYGLRNSHLISIAPAGTISLTADNVSSGIEPVFALETQRTINTEEGIEIVQVPDYAYANYRVEGKVSEQVTMDEHLDVLAIAQRHVDSAVSKTCNVGDDVSWEDFKDLYVRAWKAGCKGITTFRASGKRFGVLNAVPVPELDEGAACFIDPNTGDKSCG